MRHIFKFTAVDADAHIGLDRVWIGLLLKNVDCDRPSTNLAR